MNLYNAHRPTNLKQVVGNEDVIQMLQTIAEKPAKKRPRAFLFVGPAGCGKTTLAHIMASLFGGKGDNIEEYNSASFRGIDSVRTIQQAMQRAPTQGSTCRCFILEEAHRFTTDAQEALLKPTENCPEHVYFMLTTTAPEKLGKALLSRMTVINVKPLEEEELIAIMKRSLKKESETLDDSILKRIVASSGGSARTALTILEKVLALPSNRRKNWEEMQITTENQAIDLCRLLMRKDKPKWKEVAQMLSKITDNPESVRMCILGYASACLLNGVTKAYDIILAFETNYYDSGKAGLCKSCYEFIFASE